MNSITFRAVCLPVWLALGFLIPSSAPAETPAAVVDTITFGNSLSESNHTLIATQSQVIAGGLGASARILLPLTDPTWEGGSLSFTMHVDPDRQNYATVRLWGSDVTDNELVLFCEGKQVGYRHLGDVDLLDVGNGEPGFPNRFIYETTPLPLAMTRGKTEVHLQICSYGPTWGYAGNFEKFQNAMHGPTRGIYRLYTHTDIYFAPSPDEKQGQPVVDPPVRISPGAEVMDKLKNRVNGEVTHLLAANKPLNEMQVQFLARAYYVKWTLAYQNPTVVTQVVNGLDALYRDYHANPELAHNDPTTPNPGWFEFGPAGQAVSLLASQLSPLFDAPIDDGAGHKLTRRAAWSEMILAGRDWHRHHRRLYTNQTMITDMNIYLCNRALEALGSPDSMSEPAVRRYLYEAVGLEPWRDSDAGDDSHGWGVGTNYWQLTGQGLTRELGFVGYYGEVLDWVTSIYDATRPTPDQPGDEKIKAQLVRINAARAIFRAPGTDSDGFRAMRAETIVGWRDMGHYPGNVMYGERPTWDASPLYAVAATLDPDAIGYAQQMFDDHQFFISLERQMAQSGNLRVTAGLLGVPDQYDLIKSQPSQTKRLPMTPGQPDFVFADEEDGVVAIKNGADVLYVSLYWRAHYAVNSLARIHYTTPHIDRIAVVHEDARFTPDGRSYTRPDWTTFGFGNGGPRYPIELHSAEAGEKLPIAKIPAGLRFHPGDENVYAGKADFYSLQYGDYLIAMNLSAGQTFDLTVPPAFSGAKELVSGKPLSSATTIPIPARSTIVLWTGHPSP